MKDMRGPLSNALPSEFRFLLGSLCEGGSHFAHRFATLAWRSYFTHLPGRLTSRLMDQTSRLLRNGLFSRLPQLFAMLVCVSACTAKPVNQRFVAAFDVEGNEQVDSGDITDQLATRKTSKFAGVVRGLIYEYEVYNPYVLAEDLHRIERLYHARGFHHAKVKAGRVLLDGDKVHVNVVVDEGPRTTVQKVLFSGLEEVLPEVANAARSAFESQVSAETAYDETTLVQANDALTRSLQNNGYAYAKSEFSVRVDIAKDSADVFTKVQTGPKIVLGEISLKGFKDMPEEVIRGYLPLEPGQPYSKRAFEEAELELMNLGVFTSISVQLTREFPTGDAATTSAKGPSDSTARSNQNDDATKDTKSGDTAARDTAAEEGEQDDEHTAERSDPSRSQPTPNSTQGVGGSVADRNDGFTGAKTEPATPQAPVPKVATSPVVIEARRSKLRTLSLGGGLGADVIKSEVHLSASWRDQNLLGGLRDFLVSVTPGIAFYPTRVPEFSAPEHLLPQVKTMVQFSQPGFPEERTKTLAQINYDIYPVLLSSNPPDDAPVIGYREFRGRAGVERKFGKITLVPTYNLQAGVPFTYLGDLDPTATSVYISYVELLTELDLRNDRIRPVEGFFATTAVQFAGLGGSALDLRVQPEFRGYVPVVRHKTGFAARLGFGFLFPFNYDTPNGDNDVSVQDTQIAYFRSFFSGGPISNRGYPFRGVGPHGAVPFFYPDYAASTAGVDCGSEEARDVDSCSIPLGGRTLWEASLEFRFVISGPFTGTVFCDASDVYEETTLPTFGRPHLACGLGPRFDTPVGPIRLDIGYRIPGMQVLGSETRNEGPRNELLGLPINISFGIGEAF